MFKIAPSDIVNLIANIRVCDDADVDAEMTVKELIKQVDLSGGAIPLNLLEKCLYCCNMNYEDGIYINYHGLRFSEFLRKVLGNSYKFDYTYNRIREVK